MNANLILEIRRVYFFFFNQNSNEISICQPRKISYIMLQWMNIEWKFYTTVNFLHLQPKLTHKWNQKKSSKWIYDRYNL